MKQEEKVVEILKKHQLKLTTIESCTAGAIAARIVDVPGASEVFEQGFVTYSNEAKMRAVKVREEIFEKYGAVSGECAKEMVYGGLLEAKADIAVSATGFAGPFRWLGSTGRNCLYRLWFCKRYTGERISFEWQSQQSKRRSCCLCYLSAL